MKQDLDFVFKRIRMLKKKIQIKYPQNYLNGLQMTKENMSISDSEEQIDSEDLCDDTKPRSESTASQLSSSKSAFSNFFETARNRISSFNREQSDVSEIKPNQIEQ